MTKILTLVSIIENHDSGRKTRLKSRFSPWIGELQLPENATQVVILKSRYKRDSAEKWWIPPLVYLKNQHKLTVVFKPIDGGKRED